MHRGYNLTLYHYCDGTVGVVHCDTPDKIEPVEVEPILSIYATYRKDLFYLVGQSGQSYRINRCPWRLTAVPRFDMPLKPNHVSHPIIKSAFLSHSDIKQIMKIETDKPIKLPDGTQVTTQLVLMTDGSLFAYNGTDFHKVDVEPVKDIVMTRYTPKIIYFALLTVTGNMYIHRPHLDKECFQYPHVNKVDSIIALGSPTLFSKDNELYLITCDTLGDIIDLRTVYPQKIELPDNIVSANVDRLGTDVVLIDGSVWRIKFTNAILKCSNDYSLVSIDLPKKLFVPKQKCLKSARTIV